LLAEIEQVPQNLRRRAMIDLYSKRLGAWGATHTLRVPVVDSSGTHAYTLIHASKSAKAYMAMKEAVTYALEHSPLPEQVVSRMRDLVRSDLDTVETAVRRRFAGKSVRWAADRNNRNASCVRNFFLEESEAYPFELDELKSRLRLLQLPGRSIVYAFPTE